MSSVMAHAGAIDALTDEQRLAAACRTPNVFIEAGPGTGKTTVSAQRFGVQRFAPEYRYDTRAVVAVSFTRAATNHLRRRVQRLWGPSALAWPNRIVTLDTIVGDLLHDLLRAGLLVWPNSAALWGDEPVTLDVHDSWASFGKSEWDASAYALTVAAPNITIQWGTVRVSSDKVPAAVAVAQLAQGVCTHQDVRDVLEQAMYDPTCAARVQERLAATMRALIVDEVFDANDLDIVIIETAMKAGVAVTLVGDPWQALYVFRGAQPHLVPQMLERAGVRTLELKRSFRWRADSQRDLATDLRHGRGVTLPVVGAAAGLVNMDVVLALWWKSLWELGAQVLPLAFQSFKGSREEAAATLLLNHLTRSFFDMDATYLNDALTALGASDQEVLTRLEPDLHAVVEMLRAGGKPATKAAYVRLAEAVKTQLRCDLKPVHWRYTDRLALLQERLGYPSRLVPGLTTHQAKGGEWDVVGVRVTDSERAALAAGLSREEDTHRKLYVACTRAHRKTVEVAASS